MSEFRNRVTFYFDPEHSRMFRVSIASLEQVFVLIQYMRRCTVLDYLSYTFEVCQDRTWRVSESRDIDMPTGVLTKRADSAPLKLQLNFLATPKYDEFSIELFFFSSLDVDFIYQLISSGTRGFNSLVIKSFNRDRHTQEWVERDLTRSIPRPVADAYLALSTKAQAAILKEMKETR